jgi:hypothetical protein
LVSSQTYYDCQSNEIADKPLLVMFEGVKPSSFMGILRRNASPEKFDTSDKEGIYVQ